MSWLWIYLGAGVVILLGVLANHWLRHSENATSQLLERMRGPLTWQDKLLEKVLAPFLGSIAMVIAWPAVLFMAGKGIWDERHEELRRANAVFKVRAKDLVKQTSIAEVEASECVHDPLSAVPDLTFGHLHAVWLDFLARRPPDSELWMFACDWESEWRSVYARRGYVWVRGDDLSPWMLTSDFRKDNEND